MSEIQILNQLIDDDEGIYRVLHGNHIGYLTISTDVFDGDTMCRPYLLIPKLPKLPERDWTTIKITKSTKDANSHPLEASVTNDRLAEVETLWHHTKIDVLSLKYTKMYKSSVSEVIYHGSPAIAKIAPFEWEIPRLERETWAYSILDEERQHDERLEIAPHVLGHLTEGGRVIGLLLEKLEGEFAGPEDLIDCRHTLGRLHEMGLIHGDVNRYNFIVDRKTGKVRMVDFEHAAALDEETAQQELASLSSELGEETSRGKPLEL